MMGGFVIRPYKGNCFDNNSKKCVNSLISVEMSKQGRRHNVIPFTFLQTPGKHKQRWPTLHGRLQTRLGWGYSISYSLYLDERERECYKLWTLLSTLFCKFSMKHSIRLLLAEEYMLYLLQHLPTQWKCYIVSIFEH